MKKAKQTPNPGYRSKLREEQAARTRERIAQAAAALINTTRNPEAITFKAVAERAGVTEMTVYRHFPKREDLLRGLWGALNASMGARIGLPGTIDGLLAQHEELFTGFDKVAPQIIASLTTEQGREMRNALNDKRRAAFLAIATEAAPRLKPAERKRVAAILQLLHSAHAWMSLREQWGLDGGEAAAATRWAIESLIHNLGKKP